MQFFAVKARALCMLDAYEKGVLRTEALRGQELRTLKYDYKLKSDEEITQDQLMERARELLDTNMDKLEGAEERYKLTMPLDELETVTAVLKGEMPEEMQEMNYHTVDSPDIYAEQISASPERCIRSLMEYMRITEYKRADLTTREEQNLRTPEIEKFRQITDNEIFQLENKMEEEVFRYITAYFAEAEKAAVAYEAAVAIAKEHLSPEVKEEDRDSLAAYIAAQTPVGRRLERITAVNEFLFSENEKISETKRKFQSLHPEITEHFERMRDMRNAAQDQYRDTFTKNNYLVGDRKRVLKVRDEAFKSLRAEIPVRNKMADESVVEASRKLKSQSALYSKSSAELLNEIPVKRKGAEIRLASDLCRGFRRDEHGEVLPEDQKNYEYDKMLIEGYYGADIEKRKECICTILREVANLEVTEEMLTREYVMEHPVEMMRNSQLMLVCRDHILKENKDLLDAGAIPQDLLNRALKTSEDYMRLPDLVSALMVEMGLQQKGELMENVPEDAVMTYRMSAETDTTVIKESIAGRQAHVTAFHEEKKAQARQLLAERKAQYTALKQKIDADQATDEEKKLADVLERRLNFLEGRGKDNVEQVENVLNIIGVLASEEDMRQQEKAQALYRAEVPQDYRNVLARDVASVLSPLFKDGDCGEEATRHYIKNVRLLKRERVVMDELREEVRRTSEAGANEEELSEAEREEKKRLEDERVQELLMQRSLQMAQEDADLFESGVRELDAYVQSENMTEFLEQPELTIEAAAYRAEKLYPTFRKLQGLHTLATEVISMKEFGDFPEELQERIKTAYLKLTAYFRMSGESLKTYNKCVREKRQGIAVKSFTDYVEENGRAELERALIKGQFKKLAGQTP